MLSDSESDGDIHQLTINEHYEKAFNARKEREELWKLEEKLGSDAGETGSEDESTDEEEDEDGDELNAAADVAIFKTLAKIRDKDPVIYQKDVNVFEQEESKFSGKYSGKQTKQKGKDGKPLTLKKHILNSILEPNTSDHEDEPQPPTYVQEQAALRSEMVQAFRDAVPSEAARGADDDEDDLLVLRERSGEDGGGEGYMEFLKREAGDEIEKFLGAEDVNEVDDDQEGVEKGSKKKKKKKKREKKHVDDEEAKEEGTRESKNEKVGKDKAREDQEFLMNYILNRGWVDKLGNRVPTYKEITGEDNTTGDGEESGEKLYDALEDEDDFDEVAEEFETSYNFRFEEPNATKIATYPRSIPSTLRRKDTTRIEARQRRTERKEEKILGRREEVKRMKALRVKVLRERLERMAGKEGDVNLKELEELGVDLDGDWDPEKHDQQMAGLYERVQVEGGDDDDDEIEGKKPTWEDDINIDDIIPNTHDAKSSALSKKKKKKDKKKKLKEDGEEEGVDIDVMDADLVGSGAGIREDEEWDGSEEMRRRKLDEYMEELYKLEFNDMIGDTPTRFQYTPVPANSYALSASEVFLADDKDLNAYVSLRKIAPYRKGKNKSGWDEKMTGRLKEFREGLKEKGKMTGWGAWGLREERGGDRRRGREEGAEEGERVKKKRKGKKERTRAKEEQEQEI